MDDFFFFIYGFCKLMLLQCGGLFLVCDYVVVWEWIDECYVDIEVFVSFIEVYWDGIYDCCIG